MINIEETLTEIEELILSIVEKFFPDEPLPGSYTNRELIKKLGVCVFFMITCRETSKNSDLKEVRNSISVWADSYLYQLEHSDITEVVDYGFEAVYFVKKFFATMLYHYRIRIWWNILILMWRRQNSVEN